MLAWRFGQTYLEAEFAEPGRVEWLLTTPGKPAEQWSQRLLEGPPHVTRTAAPAQQGRGVVGTIATVLEFAA
jgi:hypothetical protein